MCDSGEGRTDRWTSTQSFGTVPTPNPHNPPGVPGESLSLLEVTSSPDALDLGDETDETDILNFFDLAEMHPEVIGSEASTACGGALPATRSDSFSRLMQEIQQPPLGLMQEEIQQPPAPVEQDDADAGLASSAMEIHGEFAVTAPPKGKPLYAAPADAAERAIQKLFPEWTLRLQRNEFNKWKKQHRVRKLTPAENEVLKKLRRTMLARVYADRARHRRAAKHGAAASQVGALKEENRRLRHRLAVLEAEAAGR